MNKLFSIVAVSASIALTACGGSSSGGSAGGVGSKDYLLEVMNQTVDSVIVPSYLSFNQKAVTLQETIVPLCTGTTTAIQVEAAQTAWQELSQQWNRIALYNLGSTVGPMNDNLFTPLRDRIDASIANKGDSKFASVRTGTITNVQSSDELNLAYSAALAPPLVGLLPLEILLFSDLLTTNDVNSTEIATSFNNGTRKCLYTAVIAADVAKTSKTVYQGWTESYKNTGKSFQQIFKDGKSVLENDNEPVVELLISIQKYLNFYKDKKILDTDSETFELVGATISDNFYADAFATIEQLKLLLQGQTGTKISFFAQMRARGASQDVALIQDNIAKVKSAIENKNLKNMDYYIGRLDGNVKRELAQGVGISLGINFADGD